MRSGTTLALAFLLVGASVATIAVPATWDGLPYLKMASGLVAMLVGISVMIAIFNRDKR